MRIIRTVAEMQKLHREICGPVGLVPTMGYLHEGHLSLIRASKKQDLNTVASIFVNPTQFGPHEDFKKYPRDEKRDMAMLENAGVDYVFAPPVEEMYPSGFDSWVEPGVLQERLEGAVRPGHFRGVCTVVAKLFTIIHPAKAYFGQKDYQQYLIIKKMASDLNLDVSVEMLPIVRESDGLALSSRNTYLSASERKAALALYRSLLTAKSLFAAKEYSADAIRRKMTEEIQRESLAEIDYVSLSDQDTLGEADKVSIKTIALVAARFGKTRLIDNMFLA
ncbi:MAG: pantoate--beta-alanine ligase [Dehalococcoides mccartyi]|uniref:Pantothenate synthetase n=2 Tax=root TaxID=1 RepID=A0AB33HQE4_9CHLR|nr:MULTISPECIES: pantoate--beta-alanine ligase [Dehalococcoides]AII59431.1 pantoate--beta-alanine ligase [Dehalococcoides mccartyi CG4]MBF4482911.1 pantoate--beta-alanine ligase [Dehalococcoides mccartyi]MBJ7532089.1 pantoate--beta-alanine ligase [Dehalococcoides mccartyi]MDP4280123.1 pantoate--beta-alanine ligase [Dehalococcoides mccartyi]MEA4879239.1 pantoate--beta-alanine ligase [Dehalococcoides mccartyi]